MTDMPMRRRDRETDFQREKRHAALWTFVVVIGTMIVVGVAVLGALWGRLMDRAVLDLPM